MLTRKAPYRHPVKQHRRQGVLVHHYERGKGKAPRETIGSRSLSGGRWRVARGGESVTLPASNIVDALRKGIDSLRGGEETVTVIKV